MSVTEIGEKVISLVTRSVPKNFQLEKFSGPNIPNQIYKTKPLKPNLPNKTCQSKTNLANQAYLAKPTKPNSPIQTKLL